MSRPTFAPAPGAPSRAAAAAAANAPPKKLKKLEHTVNRSLNLMENQRAERELHMETNATQYFFGAMLADRMMFADENPVKQVHSDLVRACVATCPPEADLLDFRPFIEKMSDEEVWRACGECLHARSLCLAGWRSIAEKPLRAVSISLGDKLAAVDLSQTPVSDGMLEAFASRLFCVETLKLTECLEFGNIGFRAITANCYDTLTNVDLSKSIKVDGETLGWLGGTMGIGRPSCKRLATINASDCVRVDDLGLCALGKGCPKLAFANFSGCERITDAGVVGLAKGCPKLKVLSLAHLVGAGASAGLTDKSLKALGRRCHQLSSLNCARSGAAFTDAGIKGLTKGCAKLQALNIAGSLLVSERGLMYIVDGARNIGTLNITGCQEITINGLRAAVEGNGYVTEAKSYFGFFPKKDSVVAKLSDQQHMIETSAAKAVQQAWSLLLKRREAVVYVEGLRRQKAARVVQRSWHAYLHRDGERRERLFQERVAATSDLQRMYRGKMDRRQVKDRLAYAKWFNGQALLWRRVQAAFRGFLVRLHDKDVARMLVEVYQNRRQEGLNAAAVFVQATVRRFLSRLRMSAWRELKGQRWRDRDHAARGIQATGRSYMAYRRRLILQVEQERIATLQNRAASRIQAAYRGLQGKYSALMTKAEIERLNRLRNRRALDCQRAFRGFLGREEAELAKLHRARENRAATRVQANWRMSRVLPWQGIKMNKTAAFVFRREELEMDERAAAADERNARRIELAIRDSASDTEEEDVEEYWNEFWDDVKDCQAWSSTRTGEVVWEEPLPQFAVEMSMLHRYVRIYWPANDEWFRALVTRFNKTKRRHRIEYPDGDHEWINFTEESDRVQVEDEDGGVVMFNAYTTPEMEARQQRAAAKNAKVRKRREGWGRGVFGGRTFVLSFFLFIFFYLSFYSIFSPTTLFYFNFISIQLFAAPGAPRAGAAGGPMGVRGLGQGEEEDAVAERGHGDHPLPGGGLRGLVPRRRRGRLHPLPPRADGPHRGLHAAGPALRKGRGLRGCGGRQGRRQVGPQHGRLPLLVAHGGVLQDRRHPPRGEQVAAPAARHGEDPHAARLHQAAPVP